MEEAYLRCCLPLFGPKYHVLMNRRADFYSSMQGSSEESNYSNYQTPALANEQKIGTLYCCCPRMRPYGSGHHHDVYQ